MEEEKNKKQIEKEGKYIVTDQDGKILSENLPKEFEDMIDLIFKKAKESCKEKKK